MPTKRGMVTRSFDNWIIHNSDGPLWLSIDNYGVWRVIIVLLFVVEQKYFKPGNLEPTKQKLG